MSLFTWFWDNVTSPMDEKRIKTLRVPTLVEKVNINYAGDDDPLHLLDVYSPLFFTPREANHYIGYRCYFGMGSVQAWRFTQRFAGLVFGILGLVLTVVMLFITNGFESANVMTLVWNVNG